MTQENDPHKPNLNSSPVPYQDRASTRDEFTSLPFPGNAKNVRILMTEIEEYLAAQEQPVGNRLKQIARTLGKVVVAQGFGSLWHYNPNTPS